MNIQFKKGVLEICALSLINSRDYYGYELVQDISENINISEGSIYPLLRRLSKEGFFETYLKESAGGPPRKYYKITEQGSVRTVSLKEEWTEFTEQVKILLDKDKSGDAEHRGPDLSRQKDKSGDAKHRGPDLGPKKESKND